ncbi:hypothetical protein P0Y35_02800 [Kiritimatiellaeota bacterium B1221]|nr:hypothetical protein [Kiritimatiellaeota bacterium B1221]
MNQLKFIPFFILLSSFSLLFSSCRSSSSSEVPMPPTPPQDRIQSAIFPENTPAEIPPSVPEVPDAIPEGISLQLKGKEVNFEDLENLTQVPPNTKVTVLAHPSTQYDRVVEIMDRLHEMGFMIDFKAKE